MFEEDQRRKPPGWRGLEKTMSFGDFSIVCTPESTPVGPRAEKDDTWFSRAPFVGQIDDARSFEAPSLTNLSRPPFSNTPPSAEGAPIS